MSSTVQSPKKETRLEHSVSDTEVLQAILKVIQKSKKWQEHTKVHTNAQLHLLAAPGFEVTAIEPSLVLKTQKQEIKKEATKLEQPTYTTLQKQADPTIQPLIYGDSKAGPSITSMYGTSGNQNFSYQHEHQMNGMYGSNNPNAMVIAGCPCGLVLEFATSNGKVAEKKDSGTNPMYSFTHQYGNAAPSGYQSQSSGYNSKATATHGF